MKIELACQDYRINRRLHDLVRIDATFVLKEHPNNVEAIAEALKRIELYLAGSINLVRSDGSVRCFHCGVKQEDDAQTCTQCGAPL